MDLAAIRHPLGYVLAALAGVATMSAGSGAQTGRTAYQVYAVKRDPMPLCPGQQVLIEVGVMQIVSRTPSSVGTSRAMPNAQVYGMVADPSIGSLSSSPVFTGATPGPGGGFYALFTFTAQKIGTTTIDFTGHFWPAFNDPAAGYFKAAPAPPVIVQVKCDYKISLYSVWQLPGERVLDVMGVVISKRVSLGADNKFSTTATMSSSAAWSGPCPGASRIKHSDVQIDGELVSNGTLSPPSLMVKIKYAPVSSTTTEGCRGKSRSDTGTPDPLYLGMNSFGTLTTVTHAMNTYVRAIGETTIQIDQVHP